MFLLKIEKYESRQILMDEYLEGIEDGGIVYKNYFLSKKKHSGDSVKNQNRQNGIFLRY